MYKKLGMLVIPLMATSLLTSCGNKSITYTITFDCTNCKALDENKKEITSVKITPASLYTTHTKFYLDREVGYKMPSESIKIEKTNKNEQVDFDYNPLTGELLIPIIDNLTVTASGVIKTLEECTWAEINEISTTGRAREFFDIYNPEKPELNCKKVQLKHQDTNKDGTDKITEGELYQTVRIIGFNEDYTELPEPGEDPDSNKSIGITFEFADLISDEKGFSLATYWNDTATIDGSNYSYKDSTIRKALNGDTNDINWFRYYGDGEDTKGTGKNRHFAGEEQYKKSVLEMLPDELTEEGILKTTSKYININDGNGWNEETVNDKLFLLSPFETGKDRSQYEEAHTTVYSYYKGAESSKRIKKQIVGSKEARDSCINGNDLDGESKDGSKFCYAGYNNNEESYYGADSWLRSPCTQTLIRDCQASYCPSTGGSSDCRDFAYDVYCRAIGVAPAFCI